MGEPKFSRGPLAVLHGEAGFQIMAQPTPALRGFTRTVAIVENRHDADLYAAAPELYEALKAITDCYGVGYKDTAKFLEHVHDFMMEGRAALAKARGEVS